MKTQSNTLLSLVLALMTAAFAALGLAGCNTTEGIGEDIEAAGSAIDKKAEEKKTY